MVLPLEHAKDAVKNDSCAGTNPANFDQTNEAKASFTDVYDEPGPAAYFRELVPLDYRIPDEAMGPLQGLIDELKTSRRKDAITVLDVGCSYGINAALLKFRSTFRALGERYLGPGATPTLEADRKFFESLPLHRPLRVIGLDVAGNAVEYGTQSGLLDRGIVADLEARDLTATERELLGSVDLIVSTGCVGYVTERTFRRIVSAVAVGSRAPMVASFVLRMFPYDGIARALDELGMTTTRFPGTYRQRRFKQERERADVLAALEALGRNGESVEARDDYLHAELFVSRPTPGDAV